jgi:hypothetical protein
LIVGLQSVEQFRAQLFIRGETMLFRLLLGISSWRACYGVIWREPRRNLSLCSATGSPLGFCWVAVQADLLAAVVGITVCLVAAVVAVADLVLIVAPAFLLCWPD